MRPEQRSTSEPDAERVGAPSNFSCPDCGGVLTLEDDVPRLYRCRVGHAYSPATLVDAQSDVIETAVWAGLRALEEKADLLTTMARDLERRGSALAAENIRRRARALGEPAAILRALVSRGDAALDPGGDEGDEAPASA